MDQDYAREVNFSILEGKTLTSVENKGDEIVFTADTGEVFRQIYYSDCCATCSVEEIHGDLNDLVGSPILMAEESSSREPDEALRIKREEAKKSAESKGEYYYEDSDSETWTFYKAATNKGSVTIRWYGSSNGYYSESATFERVSG